VAGIFELIDAGDAEGLRDLLRADPAAAAAHDEQGLSAVMRAAYRGGDVFAAVRDVEPALGPFDRIVVGRSDDPPEPDAWTPDRTSAKAAPTPSRRRRSPAATRSSQRSSAKP
jgi:hypothetical protein